MTRSENKAGRLLQIEACSWRTRRASVRPSWPAPGGQPFHHQPLPGRPARPHLHGRRWPAAHRPHRYLVNVRLNLNEALASTWPPACLPPASTARTRTPPPPCVSSGWPSRRSPPASAARCSIQPTLWTIPLPAPGPGLPGRPRAPHPGLAEQRLCHVWHRHEDGSLHEYDFAPYFIEPNAVGQSTYAIGLRQPPGALRTSRSSAWNASKSAAPVTSFRQISILGLSCAAPGASGTPRRSRSRWSCASQARWPGGSKKAAGTPPRSCKTCRRQPAVERPHCRTQGNAPLDPRLGRRRGGA